MPFTKLNLFLQNNFHLFISYAGNGSHLFNAIAAILRNKVKPKQVTVIYKSDQVFNWVQLKCLFPELTIDLWNADSHPSRDYYELISDSDQPNFIFATSSVIVNSSCFSELLLQLQVGNSTTFSTTRYLYKPTRMSAMDRWLRRHSNDHFNTARSSTDGCSDLPTFAISKESYLDYRGVKFPALTFDDFLNQLFSMQVKLSVTGCISEAISFVQSVERVAQDQL